jgi:hypothetical protein
MAMSFTTRVRLMKTILIRLKRLLLHRHGGYLDIFAAEEAKLLTKPHP